ncbi:hypothetical protein DdX_09531 [Ditylenchus destructor]|uniref:Uncharacterized protein n=1 Tax=Ditylenchus destructor TaxID=166010 RepID=A0AAD4N267_9BILA|nr:hypothetical protein DdX_09531 [Ditylenchus destructor]
MAGSTQENGLYKNAHSQSQRTGKAEIENGNNRFVHECTQVPTKTIFDKQNNRQTRQLSVCLVRYWETVDIDPDLLSRHFFKTPTLHSKSNRLCSEERKGKAVGNNQLLCALPVPAVFSVHRTIAPNRPTINTKRCPQPTSSGTMEPIPNPPKSSPERDHGTGRFIDHRNVFAQFHSVLICAQNKQKADKRSAVEKSRKDHSSMLFSRPKEKRQINDRSLQKVLD